MKRAFTTIALLCLLSLTHAIHLTTTKGKSNQFLRLDQQLLIADLDQIALIQQQQQTDESYNPWSDKFRFHSLYENLPEADYQSLAADLAVFVAEEDQIYFKIPLLTEDLINEIMDKNTSQSGFVDILSEANVFRKLGLYQQFTDDETPAISFPLIKNENYCDEVDMLNLIQPSNLFQKYNVLTTIFIKSAQKMIHNVSDSFYLPTSQDKPLEMVLRPNISVMQGHDENFDVLRSTGLNYGCITQTYNTINGAQKLSTKDFIVKYFEDYKQRNLPKTCINYDKFFPSSYRLFTNACTIYANSEKEECQKFFEIIGSEKYLLAKSKEPVQYLLKIGSASHQGKGVDVLSNELEKVLLANYSDGKACGSRKDDLIAQKYISNPLLIYNQQKFDFRVYVLLASTNPLVAYYSDGFARVSLRHFDANSSDKQSHLTNSHLSDEIVNQAKTEEEKTKLLEMQLSTFEMLADDLENKKILSGEQAKQNFLNELRKKFKNSIAHILRMTLPAVEERSGTYRIMGFDFMLDTDMNLWFIEANKGPQMTQIESHRRHFTQMLIRDALEIEFAYLRSRVKRLRAFVQKAAEEYRVKKEEWDKEALVKMFKDANKEKLENEFKITKQNVWDKIIDLSTRGSEEDGYLGNLDRSCFN